MARQQDACWRCGVAESINAPSRPPADPAAVALLRAQAEIRLSAERWIDEGGAYADPPARRVMQAVGQ
jgi:hypothetical protein